MRIPGTLNWCGTFNDAPAFITATERQAFLMVYDFVRLEWTIKSAATTSNEMHRSLGIDVSIDNIEYKWE